MSRPSDRGQRRDGAPWCVGGWWLALEMSVGRFAKHRVRREILEAFLC
jgi:hypothetical protein